MVEKRVGRAASGTLPAGPDDCQANRGSLAALVPHVRALTVDEMRALHGDAIADLSDAEVRELAWAVARHVAAVFTIEPGTGVPEVRDSSLPLDAPRPKRRGRSRAPA